MSKTQTFDLTPKKFKGGFYYEEEKILLTGYCHRSTCTVFFRHCP